MLYKQRCSYFSRNRWESYWSYFSNFSSSLSFAVHMGSIGGIFLDFTASQFLFFYNRGWSHSHAYWLDLPIKTIKFSSAMLDLCLCEESKACCIIYNMIICVLLFWILVSTWTFHQLIICMVSLILEMYWLGYVMFMFRNRNIILISLLVQRIFVDFSTYMHEAWER